MSDCVNVANCNESVKDCVVWTRLGPGIACRPIPTCIHDVTLYAPARRRSDIAPSTRYVVCIGTVSGPAGRICWVSNSVVDVRSNNVDAPALTTHPLPTGSATRMFG